MPDPVDALPYELWIWCMEFVIDGREAGPLELLGVSRRWERVLLDTPSLWIQIYVQNGEDESARISTFLYFSKGCSLHVDIMTALPTMDSLKLIADHISRVTTISIRPGVSDTMTALSMEQWKQAAAYNLAKLFNGLVPSDVESTSCFGISLWENSQLYYCITLIQLAMATTVNSAEKQNPITSGELPITPYSQMWDEYITRTTRVSADQDPDTRTDSIYLLVEVASYAQHYGAIRTAIPSCIKLLKDNDRFVQLATIDVLHKFAVHIELHGALGLAITPLITLLEETSSDIRLAAVSLLGTLAEHDEFHEALGLTIPSLIKLLQHGYWDVIMDAAPLLGKLAEHDEFHEALGFTIPLLIELLEHMNAGVRSAATSLLGKLAGHNKPREALGLAIPLLIKPLEHWNPGVQSAAVSLLGKLAGHDELQESLRLTIPALIKLLERGNSGVVPATISLLEKLAEHGEPCEALRFAILPLRKLTEHDDSDVRSAAISILGTLAEHGIVENSKHFPFSSTNYEETKLIEAGRKAYSGPYLTNTAQDGCNQPNFVENTARFAIMGGAMGFVENTL